ncbi:MAG: hypothetical protein ACR2O0_00995 [Rhizobiaceae bacterium]
MKLPLNVRTNASSDLMIAGKGQFTAVSLVSIGVICLFMYLLEQIGVPQNYSEFLFAVFFSGTLCIIGLRSATVYFSDWFISGTRVAAPINGMAMAVTCMTAGILLTLPGLYFSESFLAPAILAAPLAGLALSSIFTGPIITQSGVVSPGAFLSRRYKSRVLTLLVLVATATCCLLLLWSQLSVIGALGTIFAGVQAQYIIFPAAALVAVTVVPGGLFSVIRANVFCYLLVVIAVLGAVTWLSVTTTSIPIPHLGMGPGALDAVSSLETQLDAVRIPRVGTGIETGWPLSVTPFQTLAIFFVLAIGFMALPSLMAGFQPVEGPQTARRSITWAILFCALVLSAAPAISAFTKIGIYSNLLGITSGEIAETSSWMFWWSGQNAVFSPGEPLVELCGRMIQSTTDAVAVCGGNPDHAVGPADIEVHGELPLYALAQLMALPQALTVLMAAGLIGASIAVANMLAFAFGSTLSEDGRACFTSRPLPEVARVFSARLSVMIGITFALFLAQTINVNPLEPALWAFAISASIIAPCLVLSIWWRRITYWAAITGLLVPSFILLVFFSAQIELGNQWPLFAAINSVLGKILPVSGNMPVAISAASLAIPIALISMVAVSFLAKKPRGGAGMALIQHPGSQ